MTDTPDPSLDPSDTLDPAAERAARHGRILAELAEIGLDLARTLRRQAEAQDQLQDVAERAGVAEVVGGSVTVEFRGDLGRTYDRLSRAIRLTLHLETRVAEGEVARRAQAALARAKTARAERAAAVSAWTKAREATVLRVVEKTLEADGLDDEAIVERLTEARENLNEFTEFDVSELPVGLVIARICKEIGAKPDWAVWANEAWAIEEAQDRPRGSPYARGGFGGDGADDPPGADTDLAEAAGGSP